MKAVVMEIKDAVLRGRVNMLKVFKRKLAKKNSYIKLYLEFSTNSVGSENCCNGSFACCGATSCG
jgi:hypothetical protein